MGNVDHGEVRQPPGEIHVSRMLVLHATVILMSALVPGAGGFLLNLSKMEDFVDATPLPQHYNVEDGEEFDYIVVGAGAAGCAAAARLAEAGHSVLLAEAGGDPSPLTRIPSAALSLRGSSDDWQYKTISNNVSCLGLVGQQCSFSRGKCVGGSTAINYMLYVRGNRQDYELNLTGWTWDDLEPYFLRFEGLQDLSLLPPTSTPYHNTLGSVQTGFFDSPKNPWHWRLKEAFQTLNFPFNVDLNAESQIGVTQVIGYVYKGERMSAARAYLTRENVAKLDLKVAIKTHCTGIIFDDNNVAEGITAVHGATNKKIQLYARREVVLSAGAIGTPQILMLSGIGPADHLNTLGIPMRSNLPVGNNMSDHVLALIFILVDRNILSLIQDIVHMGLEVGQWFKHRNGPFASNGLTDVMALVNTRCYDSSKRRLVNNGTECEFPTVQIIHAYLERGVTNIARPIVKQSTLLNDEIINQLATANSESAIILAAPIVLRPYSRGVVRLHGRDPLDHPAIYPNYLDNEEDVEEILRAITILEHLMDTPVFRKQNASILHLKLPSCPGYAKGPAAAEYWRCYVRHLTSSVYHAAGTSALGSVLDAHMRVRGVHRLRVADLGALPEVPRGNTAAAAIALGERVADLLLHDHKHTYFKKHC